MILRTTYDGTGGGVTEDKRFYYAQNWRADVSVVLDDAGVQQERVSYSPYGQPFAMPAGDTNFDGDHEAGVDGDELADWDINGVPYRAYADVNLDGDIDGADATAASVHDLGWNVLTSGGGGASGVNNRLGYAGYIHDRDVVLVSFQRSRASNYALGRTLQRRLTDGLPPFYCFGHCEWQYEGDPGATLPVRPTRYQPPPGPRWRYDPPSQDPDPTTSGDPGETEPEIPGSTLIDLIGELGVGAEGKCCFPTKIPRVVVCLSVSYRIGSISVCHCRGLTRSCTVRSLSAKFCVSASLAIGSPGCEIKSGPIPEGEVAFARRSSVCPKPGEHKCKLELCLSLSGFGVGCKWCTGGDGIVCSAGGYGKWPALKASGCASCTFVDGDPECACDYLD